MTTSKRKHSQSAPTMPPPPASSRGKQQKTTARPAVRRKTSPKMPAAKQSAIKKRKPHESDIPGATVDEVVADFSKDPRRERD